MLLMFERGIRGGITQAVHRYAKANNSYMDEKFNPDESTSYLQYLDANNLYGWARSQPLPTGGFRWVSIGMECPASGDPNEIGELTRHTDKGYLLEVDVKYPKELQIPLTTSHLCVRRWRLTMSENWFFTYTTSEIMLSTFEHWIKPSRTD